MPVGSDLARRIELQLNSEFAPMKNIRGPISNSLASDGGGFGSRHIEAATRIRRAIHARESIDDLLDDWRENQDMVLIGKMAIALVIQKAEADTHLGLMSADENSYLDCISTLRETWLGQVIRHLQATKNRRQLAELLKEVGFIIFNYDRCVEQILVGELACNTTMDLAQARSYVRSMHIVHPYGCLGTAHGPAELRRFGSESDLLVELSKGIRTYTEEMHDANDLARMRNILSKAQTTIFLGFGYHPKNVSLLMDHGLNIAGHIHGACLDPSPARLTAAQREFFPAGPSENLQNINCRDFIWNWRGPLFGAT